MLGLGRKSAEQRIAHAIADLYHRLEQRAEVDARTHSMPFPLTQEMLGELTGLTPVHTNRVLRKLRTDGVMVCERQRVEILDLPRLLEAGRISGQFHRLSRSAVPPPHPSRYNRPAFSRAGPGRPLNFRGATIVSAQNDTAFLRMFMMILGALVAFTVIILIAGQPDHRFGGRGAW